MLGMDEATERAVRIEYQCRKERPDFASIKANALMLIMFVDNAAAELKQINNHV